MSGHIKAKHTVWSYFYESGTNMALALCGTKLFATLV